MHPYTKEGRAATAATEEAVERQHGKTGDGAGEDGDEDTDEDDDNVAEVTVWVSCLVATPTPVVEGIDSSGSASSLFLLQGVVSVTSLVVASVSHLFLSRVQVVQ